MPSRIPKLSQLGVLAHAFDFLSTFCMRMGAICNAYMCFISTSDVDGRKNIMNYLAMKYYFISINIDSGLD